MSTSQISSLLSRIKQQREQESKVNSKPFPLEALLYMVEISSREVWYCPYFEGFKLLRDWLAPIQITQAPEHTRIPILFRTYEIQEIATHLNTSQANIYHGYKTALSVIQFNSDPSLMPAQVPIIQDEFTS